MLPREILKRIRKIEIVTQRLVRDRMAGQYHSVFKGRGMAFAEVRQYIPGDDIRLIDWNVSARMNDAYVKLFSEEREMTVLLLVDMSASGRFGSRVREKRDLAAEIAAVLAFSAIRNNDRVGLIIFTDEVERFVPPKKGKRHVLRVVSEILVLEREEPAHLDRARGWSSSGTWRRRRAVAFLISDFLAPVARLRAGAAHRLAAPRSRAGDGGRSAGGGAARRRASSSSRIPRPAARRVRHERAGGGGVRAQGPRAATEARRRCSSGCRWTRSRSAPTAPTCPR